MPSMWYDNGIKAIMTRSPNSIDLDSDTIRIMLLEPTYVQNKGHQFVTDVSGDEISATNYTGGFSGSGRKALVNKIVSISSSRIILDANDTQWPSLGGASNADVGYAPIYKEVSTDANSLLILCLMFSPVTTNAGDFTVKFYSEGIAYADNA